MSTADIKLEYLLDQLRLYQQVRGESICTHIMRELVERHQWHQKNCSRPVSFVKRLFGVKPRESKDFLEWAPEELRGPLYSDEAAFGTRAASYRRRVWNVMIPIRDKIAALEDLFGSGTRTVAVSLSEYSEYTSWISSAEKLSFEEREVRRRDAAVLQGLLALHRTDFT